MLKTILFPTDGSESGQPVLNSALELLKQVDGKLIVLSVAGTLSYNPLSEDVPSIDWKDYEAQQRRRAQSVLDDVSAQAAQAGVACDTLLEQSDDPAAVILDTAQKLRPDAIFMASHRRSGLTRLFVGSETQKVLSHASTPVMVFRWTSLSATAHETKPAASEPRQSLAGTG